MGGEESFDSDRGICIGRKESEDGRWAIVISSPHLLHGIHTLLKNNAVSTIDGNFDHNAPGEGGLLMMGVYDNQHHFRPIALAVVNKGEGQTETKMCLDILDAYLKREGGSGLPTRSRWMLDGFDGLRGGVQEFDRSADIGMCYFHMAKAARQHVNKLPQGKWDQNNMIQDVRRLAATSPEYFASAWKVVKTAWPGIGVYSQNMLRIIGSRNAAVGWWNS
jgi:hypothetical protein